MIRIFVLLLALAGCASHPQAPTSTRQHSTEDRQERARDAVRQMQDEFNRVYPDG
jgi:hypothetical protein